VAGDLQLSSLAAAAVPVSSFATGRRMDSDQVRSLRVAGTVYASAWYSRRYSS
jgi:hypothetical protein